MCLSRADAKWFILRMVQYPNTDLCQLSIQAILIHKSIFSRLLSDSFAICRNYLFGFVQISLQNYFAASMEYICNMHQTGKDLLGVETSCLKINLVCFKVQLYNT